ncbi:hypothetical protein GCM10025868_10810 [Angustibacter aerolatus]|uniref:NADPH-dependent FMN reductase-like domain-containing protein n=1 Tax=Angustibacter aerolatus TaxID=1162965 RepID=A0ABQ6JE18_9ACTN|nr:hypothetical protein GCM10025868_10810 [Angustibacter aerolatus]
MLTGFAAPALQEVLDAVAGADGLIAVTPTFNAAYSGLFKSFADLLDGEALDGTPVLLGATGGTERHSLVLDHAMRPLFAYLHADVVARGVYAASSDWGARTPRRRWPVASTAPPASLAQAVAARPARSRPDDDDGFVPFEQPARRLTASILRRCRSDGPSKATPRRWPRCTTARARAPEA